MSAKMVYRLIGSMLLLGFVGLNAADYYTTENISDGSEPNVKYYIVTPEGKTEVENHSITTITKGTTTVVPPKPVRTSWCTQSTPSTNSCIMETCPTGTANPIKTITKTYLDDYKMTSAWWSGVTTSGIKNSVVSSEFRYVSGWSSNPTAYFLKKQTFSSSDPFLAKWRVYGPCGETTPYISYEWLKSNGSSYTKNVCGSTVTANLSIVSFWWTSTYNYSVTLKRPYWVTVKNTHTNFNTVAALPLCNPPAAVTTEYDIINTQDGITNNTVTIETGKLKYKKAPTMGTETASRTWGRFTYKNPYTSWNPVSYTAKGGERIGYSSAVGCSDPKSCPENPSRESVYMEMDGTIKAYNINPLQPTDTSENYNGTSDVSKIYSFISPSAPTLPGLCAGADHACLTSKYLGQRPDLLEWAFGIKYGRGVSVATDMGVTSVSDTTVYFSKRLLLQQILTCPVNLLDSSGQNTWWIEKFNDGAYENMGEATTTPEAWNEKVTGQDAQVHEDMAKAVDRTIFDNSAVTYNKDFLAVDEGELSKRVCQKKLCPKYFSPFDSSITNKTEICKMEIKKPEINGKIPKRLFVVYPDINREKNTYSVPNLGDYFKGGTAQPFNYEITEIVDTNGDVLTPAESPLTVSISGGSALNIEVPKSAAVENHLTTNGKKVVSIKLMIKQNMEDNIGGVVNYSFNNRAIGIEFPIEVTILSPLYTPNSQEVYRCQPLTKE